MRARSNSRGSSALDRISRAIAPAVGAVTAVVLALFGLVLPASAQTVYELEGEWADGTPEVVQTGEGLAATWYLNVNDDAEAPGNEPVDNVTFEVTLANAYFGELPAACLTDGVDPISSISADGDVLTCNIGTVDEGSATVTTTGIVADGATNDQISATASIEEQVAELPEITIVNDFAMDIRWEANTGNGARNGAHWDLDFQWSLFHAAGAVAGPDSVSYTITPSSSVGSGFAIVDCGPFTSGNASGHPYSGGNHDDAQMAPSADCAVADNGDGTFTLTLSGIDYSKDQVPTQDSTGDPLPTNLDVVASGQITLRVLNAPNAGNVQIEVSAPEYTSVEDDSAFDDPENNSSTQTWTSGVWTSAWRPQYTGQSGSAWSDTYRVAAGTTVQQNISLMFGRNPGDINVNTFNQCLIFDTAHVEFVDVQYGAGATWDAELREEGVEFRYYTGDSPLVNPGSGSYDPNEFECTDDPSGWVTTMPADLSQVRAVHAVVPAQTLIDNEWSTLRALTTIHEDTPTGTDVWFWSGYTNNNGAWRHPNRSWDVDDMPASGTATPDARYPFAAGGRDILRIISAEPAVTKSADPAVVLPNDTVAYELTYLAEGSGAIPETVDGYELVDTLPVGMTYEPGSATPEPAVTEENGQQVLTWTLDEVPTNTENTLTYQATASGDVAPGERLENTVTASFEGVEDNAAATVTVSSDGSTQIIKTADQAFIPNPGGDGVGEGSWTVTLRSYDPAPQAFTDTIDILPYVGDGRGTDFAGSYELTGVEAEPGATVYYTTADPANLSDDPADPSNGAAGNPEGNTVGWTTEFTPEATAVRVIGPELAPNAMQDFVVGVVTDGAQAEDVLVNRAQGRAENTRLTMRTSAETSIANYYSADLKKYVQDVDGEWRDANDSVDYPAFRVGDTVTYRIVVTNTGGGTLTNIEVTDDVYPGAGSFVVDSLAPEESYEHEFEITIDDETPSQVVNTACAEADTPPDADAPEIPCDPAGFDVDGEPTHTKDLISATPAGDGQWELVYGLEVENTSIHDTSYSLSDTLHFTDQADIELAEVIDSPAGVDLADPAWDGQQNTLIAGNVDLLGNEDAEYGPHYYEIRVLADVPLQLDGAGGADDPTQCGPEGDDSNTAFNNVSAMTDATGEVEEDQACAPIPSIDITKGVSDGPTATGEGTWTVTYDVVVTNTGAGEGIYDLSDQMNADGDLQIIDTAISDTPEDVAVNPDWTGLGDEGAAENVITTDVAIDAGAEHTYQIEVTLGVDDADGAPIITDCAAMEDGDQGGLSNSAGVEHNDLADDDTACVTVGYVVLDKSISDGPNANGDGTWTVTYDVVAENVGGAATEYDISDRLRYGEGIDIVSVDVITTPDGVEALDTWTGLGAEDAQENLIATDVAIDAGQEHLYQVEAVISLDEVNIDPVDLQCPPPGSGENGGLANGAAVDSNGIIATDEECASLPLIDMTKTIADGPEPIGNGAWMITYDVVVDNIGQAEGDYDLADDLRYGEGIVITDATIAETPGGVDVNDEWTGQGEPGSPENVIATGVTLGAGDSHAYGIQVTVTLDDDAVTPGALECPEPGSGESGGLANGAELTHNGQVQEDDVCATLPLIDVAKSVSGDVTPVDGEQGVYDATYQILVANSGSGEGAYDLDDALAPGEGVTVLGVQEVSTDAPDSVGINPDFDGLDDIRIVTDQPIAGAEGAPVVHTYTVVVRYALDLSEVEDVAEAGQCLDDDGATVAGGLHNVAEVAWNGNDGADEECVLSGRPTLDKTLASAEPIGDGQWQVVYDLTVGNVGGEAITYDLDDEFLFAPVITVDQVAVDGPAGVDLEDSFDGIDNLRIATGAQIDSPEETDYAPHVYRVTVVVNVPLTFEEAEADGTGAPECTSLPGGNFTEQGLNNAATLTDETGGTQQDTDCAPLPSITIDKTIDGEPALDGDGNWTVTYLVDVTNDGAAAGVYDLTDRLRYGAGIEVQQAAVTDAPEGVAVAPGWTGQGEEGAGANVIATGVDLDAGQGHQYTIEVIASVDTDAVDESTFTCPDPGSGEAGGFANTAGLAHNGHSAQDDACAEPDPPGATPDEPGESVPGVPSTGVQVTTIVGIAALLVLLGLLTTHTVRRRSQN